MSSNSAPPAGTGRQVVASTFVTLDGYMVGPDEDISWVIDGFDPVMADDIAQDMSRWDMFVLGRITYEIFAGYWPHAEPYDDRDALNPAAGKEDPRIIRALNERPKLVFSRTLTRADWQHARIASASPEDEIRRLRRQPGGVSGGRRPAAGGDGSARCPARADRRPRWSGGGRACGGVAGYRHLGPGRRGDRRPVRRDQGGNGRLVCARST